MSVARLYDAAAPRVSVIVPVRNRRTLLRELLEGLEQQSFRDFEAIVVDDASDEDVVAEVHAAADRGLAVRAIRLDRARGAVGARIAGVADAKGEILAFTDSDCVPDAGWLRAGVAAIDGGAALVQGRTIPRREVKPLERSLWGEVEDGLYPTCNVFYRRSAYDDAGGFEPEGHALLGFRAGRQARGLGFGEDTLLGWRVRRATGQVSFERDALVEHQVFPFDGRASFSRAWQAGAFAALVREVPELRGTLLRRRYLLGDRAQLWLLGAFVALVLRRWPIAAALALPWVWHHAKRVNRHDPRWPYHLSTLLALEGVTEAALLAGIVKTRCVVI